MAERRPVTALEIRRDVEGYSAMNEDAFARRFYADRSELDSLGIALTVERPVDGVAEQENYSLRPENFHLPGDRVLRRRARRRCRPRCRCSTASSPTPSRCAWRCSRSRGAARTRCTRPSSASVGARHHGVGRRPRALPAPGEDRDGDLPQQDDHVRLLHDGARRHGHAQGRPLPPALPGRVLPARPRPRARGAARLPAVAHPRQGRLRDEGRARLQGPARGLRPARRTPTAPTGSSATPTRPPRSRSPSASPGRSSATSAASARSSPPAPSGDIVFATPYADRRQLAAWVLRLGEHARVLGPPELERELAERVELLLRAPPAARDARARRPGRRRATPRRPRPSRASNGSRAHARPRSAPSASRAS